MNMDTVRAAMRLRAMSNSRARACELLYPQEELLVDHLAKIFITDDPNLTREWADECEDKFIAKMRTLSRTVKTPSGRLDPQVLVADLTEMFAVFPNRVADAWRSYPSIRKVFPSAEEAKRKASGLKIDLPSICKMLVDGAPTARITQEFVSAVTRHQASVTQANPGSL